VQPDDKICLCFHVTKRKIVNHIRIHQPRVPSQVSECGGAGTGCGWCVPFLKKYFQEWKDGCDADETMTPEEYATSRGRYIEQGGGTPPAGATPPPKS